MNLSASDLENPQALLAALPFSQACENNKDAILTVLQAHLHHTKTVLEIGSGTGQHCVYFAKHLAHLCWQPSEQKAYLDPLALRIALQGSANIAAPITLAITPALSTATATSQHSQAWPVEPQSVNAIFTANTLHIMSAEHVIAFFEGVRACLNHSGQVFIYGPFNYHGQYTSPSNQDFDAWLKARDPKSGIRDSEWITQLGAEQGLKLIMDNPMPANNRLLHFRLS